jgi:opacity protein-like surface antigen
MIRFSFAATALAVLISSFALAQDAPPKVQVFGGYSLLHADAAGLTSQTMDFVLGQGASTFALKSNFNGWSAEAQYNLDRWIGIAVDFGGQSGGPITTTSFAQGIGGLPNGNSYSVLAGPVISYRTKSKLTPYVHALFGVDRARLDGGSLTGVAGAPVSFNAETYTDFAIALGGGVDYRLTRHFAIRAGQLDWFHTSVNYNKFYGSAFDSDQFEGIRTRQRNLRFSAGVVVQF